MSSSSSSSSISIVVVVIVVVVVVVVAVVNRCININKYLIWSGINRTTMNLLLKVSRFFYNLQVNVLLSKIFLAFESFVS